MLLKPPRTKILRKRGSAANERKLTKIIKVLSQKTLSIKKLMQPSAYLSFAFFCVHSRLYTHFVFHPAERSVWDHGAAWYHEHGAGSAWELLPQAFLYALGLAECLLE